METGSYSCCSRVGVGVILLSYRNTYDARVTKCPDLSLGPPIERQDSGSFLDLSAPIPSPLPV